MSTDELRLRKKKRDKERHDTNRESCDAAEAANPELREERKRKQAEANETRKAAEAENPELREERKRKQAEANETFRLKRGAAEAENPELRVARLEKKNKNVIWNTARRRDRSITKSTRSESPPEARIPRSTQEGSE